MPRQLLRVVDRDADRPPCRQVLISKQYRASIIPLAHQESPKPIQARSKTKLLTEVFDWIWPLPLSELQGVPASLPIPHFRFPFAIKAARYGVRFRKAQSDLGSVAIVRALPKDSPMSPMQIRCILLLIRTLFDCPDVCVQSADDKEPKVTLLLLEHLREHESPDAQSDTEIEEVQTFVMRQAEIAQHAK